MYPGGHALPDANRSPSLVFGSMKKDLDNIRHRKVQLINFLSGLESASANSALAGKIVEPTEQKDKGDIIVLDSDDEDGNSSEYNKLASGANKDLRTSEVAGNITEKMASNKSQASETMHAYGDKNTQIVPYGQQIVPYGQGSSLVNQFPLQTSWQPSIQFERIVLQKRPKEQRMQDVVVAGIEKKRAETQMFLSLPTEKKRKRSDLSLRSDLGLLMLDSFVPKQRRKGDTGLAAADLSLDLQQTATSPEPNMAIQEEEKHKNESDGLDS